MFRLLMKYTHTPQNTRMPFSSPFTFGSANTNALRSFASGEFLFSRVSFKLLYSKEEALEVGVGLNSAHRRVEINARRIFTKQN